MEALLKDIQNALSGTAFENRVYLVGGAVRDRLLGLRPVDPDLMAEGDACALVRLLSEKGAGERPVFLPRFNTAKIYCRGFLVEVTGARTDAYSKGSRLPEVLPADIEKDAFRRDFTVNALYKNLFTGELLDPTGMGLDDLQNRVLRTCREPYASFCEDPLRILRAVRYASLPGFEPLPELCAGAERAAEGLETLSAERKRDELEKLLSMPSPRKGLELFLRLGAAAYVIPELCPLAGCPAGKGYGCDVWEHTLRVAERLPDAQLRLAALLHDVSKPAVMTPEGRFPGHAAASAKTAAEILARLRFPKARIQDACRLIEEHNSFFRAETDSEFRECIHRNRDILPRLLLLMEADKNSYDTGLDRFGQMKERLGRLAAPGLLEKELSPLSGSEISSLAGLTGKKAGEAKERLRQMVLAGELVPGDKRAAEKALKEMIKEL